jgi:hypothetical protein
MQNRIRASTTSFGGRWPATGEGGRTVGGTLEAAAQERDAPRHLTRLVLCLIVAFVFGLTTSRIPAPRDPSMVWVGNLAAPWLALPFLTGWVQRSWPWAAVTGGLAVVVCVAGFYLNTLPPLDRVYLGIAPSTSSLELVMAALSWWLGSHTEWFTAGAATGLVFGLLGCWWGKSRQVVAGVFLAAPFLFEAAAGIRAGRLHSLVVWVLEAVVGVVVLAWVVASRKTRGLALRD